MSTLAGRRAGRSHRRLARNVAIGAAAGGVVAAVFYAAPPRLPAAQRLSLGTAYAGALLLAWVLLIGPWAVRAGRRPPTSTTLRRDVGLWSAAFAAAHTVVGFRVHLRGRVADYFTAVAPGTGARRPRLDAFGATNAWGLVAVALVLACAAVSSDRALGALGARRWKALQRSTYAAAALVLAHGLVYQRLEGRARVGVAGLLALGLLVAGAQLWGRRRYTERLARGERAKS